MPRPPVERVVRSARRRLVAQALADRVNTFTAVALAVGLVWLLAEPLVVADPPAWLRWTVLGAAVGIVTLAAVVRTIRKAPSPLAAALAADARFALAERLTSAVSLPPFLRDTPAGRAVLADAAGHAEPLRVRDQFPVRLRRSALGPPVLAGCVALVAFVYHPVVDSGLLAEMNKPTDAEAAKLAAAQKSNPPAARPPRPPVPERTNKSDAVKELEATLDRLEREARESQDRTPAETREKLPAVTAAEERAKQAERKRFDKLTRLDQQLRQLDKLNTAEGFKDGPAEPFNDALSRGDLKAAEEAVEELRKKAKGQKLDPKAADALDRQLAKMGDELQRLSRDQDRRDTLEELIRKAKAEGRDADALERELNRLKADAEQLKALADLAQKLRDAQKALKGGDAEQLARELERIAGQMRDLRGEVDDLHDLQDQVARLRELKDAMTGRPGTGGTAAGERPGVGAGGSGPGAGPRPENPSAPTARGPDERQRGPFDARGRKGYGGAVAGPAFTPRSPVELSGAIEQAVQEAPEALDAQRVPRDDRDAVKEFYQRLGNQKP